MNNYTLDPTVELPLPTSPYTIKIGKGGFEFTIKPLSDDAKDKLQRIRKLGGKVVLSPEENPTSIFVSCDVQSNFQKYNYDVVGTNLKAHLYLIGAKSEEIETRLDNFLHALYAVSMNKEPGAFKSVLPRMKTVVNVYEF